MPKTKEKGQERIEVHEFPEKRHEFHEILLKPQQQL